MKCDLCKREGNNNIWILGFYNLENLFVCDECNLGVSQQIWHIIIPDFKEK